MATTIAYRSFAKINLYLDVLDRRQDGYHNIETVFQSVSLADEIHFTEEKKRLSLVCNIPDLHSGPSNLIWQAADLLRQHTGCKSGARIRLEKHIPIAAGLAGGSGNAAAALVALNDLWDLRLSMEELSELAGRLGSDVPFCLIGGTIAATGRGEILEQLPPLPETWFVLQHPPIAVSASRIYNSPYLEHSSETTVSGKTPSFKKAIQHLAEHDLSKLIFNRMESAVFASHPNLEKAKEALLAQKCTAAAMSGSGPTIFGVCSSKRKAVAVAHASKQYPSSVVCSTPSGLERIQ